jgi:hypothetical protein
MSKGKVILIALICILAGAAAAAFWLKSEPAKIDVNRNGSGDGDSGPVPQVITRTFQEENAVYSVDVEYPELQGLANGGVQAKVNNEIKAGVYGQVAAFHANNALILPDENPDLRSAFAANHKVTLLTGPFFSGIIGYSDYSSGAAHANHYSVALNYNLKTGSAVTLDQLLQDLRPSAGYFERLAQYVMADLRRQFGDSQDVADVIEFGAKATTENYRNFNLDEEGLTIQFDPYQVAPYAAGSPQVKITYEALMEDVLRSPAVDPAATSSPLWWLE